MKHLIAGFWMAMSFLTISPVKQVEWDQPTTRNSLPFFPICGLFIGTVAAGITAIFTYLFPLLPVYLTAFIIFAALLLLYGGLHLDGWMDVSDAMGSWRDKERKLEIMKDSHVGSAAVWTTILLLGARFVSILAVVEATDHSLLYLAIFLIPVLTRTAMGCLIISAPLAKEEGLAAWFQQSTNLFDTVKVVVIGVVIVVIAAVAFAAPWLFILVLLVGSVAGYTAAQLYFQKTFGGINGDMAGALSEGLETMLWMISALFIFSVMV
ncbi:adenosylcobinamide-GDP ribazoletransferase [Bacillus piscicola]|uniref:adenosylcobinamide-GDP ribazoletransferase n=1 Tax=Bacillus piscicola TaxID=1632684 RepID=UPI001F0989CB|nr:adenosylcobinamide-GDP ribazoletransferase [Bacillus piscicola]